MTVSDHDETVVFESSPTPSANTPTGPYKKRDPGQTDKRTSASLQGGDAVGHVVLLQTQLLLVEVHRGGVDARSLQVQPDPLAPLPPVAGAGDTRIRVEVKVYICIQYIVCYLYSNSFIIFYFKLVN